MELRKLLKNKFFESAVGYTGERATVLPILSDDATFIDEVGPDTKGALEFTHADNSKIGEIVDGIYGILTDLGAEFINYETEFGIVSMTVPHKAKNRISDLMGSYDFTHTSETFGDEMRGGKSTYGRVGSFGAGSFAAGGTISNLGGYQMSRLIGESNKKPLSHEELLALIMKNKANPHKPFGGNCGQFILGLCVYVFDKFQVEPDALTVSVITDYDDEDDFGLEGDCKIYHVYLGYNGKLYDGTGEITTKYLLDFSKREYEDEDPAAWTFYLPAEKEKIRKIVSFNTNWDSEWTDYYKFLSKK